MGIAGSRLVAISPNGRVADVSTDGSRKALCLRMWWRIDRRRCSARRRAGAHQPRRLCQEGDGSARREQRPRDHAGTHRQDDARIRLRLCGGLLARWGGGGPHARGAHHRPGRALWRSRRLVSGRTRSRLSPWPGWAGRSLRRALWPGPCAGRHTQFRRRPARRGLWPRLWRAARPRRSGRSGIWQRVSWRRRRGLWRSARPRLCTRTRLRPARTRLCPGLSTARPCRDVSRPGLRRPAACTRHTRDRASRDDHHGAHALWRRRALWRARRRRRPGGRLCQRRIHGRRLSRGRRDRRRTAPGRPGHARRLYRGRRHQLLSHHHHGQRRAPRRAVHHHDHDPHGRRRHHGRIADPAAARLCRVER